MRQLLALGLVCFLASTDASAQGDPKKGRQYFGACAACHSLKPDTKMTGPSLAGLWHRKAGSLASFDRYSKVLRDAQITWDGRTLDVWLADPASMFPGNRMKFPGIKDARARSDLIAFLAERTSPGRSADELQEGDMSGMMASDSAPNLRQLTPDQQVKSISICRDTYKVTTGTGETLDFWERNLRFKTDSSRIGPARGAPAIIGAGMAGDRASVIFSAPEEISAWVKSRC